MKTVITPLIKCLASSNSQHTIEVSDPDIATLILKWYYAQLSLQKFGCN